MSLADMSFDLDAIQRRAAGETTRGTTSKAAASLPERLTQAVVYFLMLPVNGRMLGGDEKTPITMPPDLIPVPAGVRVDKAAENVATAVRDRHGAACKAESLPGMAAPVFVYLSDYTKTGEPVRFALRFHVPTAAKNGIQRRDGFTLSRPPETMDEWKALVAQADEETQSLVASAVEQYLAGASVTAESEKAPRPEKQTAPAPTIDYA